MKKIYDKNELNFALIWIGIYVVMLSVGDSIMIVITEKTQTVISGHFQPTYPSP